MHVKKVFKSFIIPVSILVLGCFLRFYHIDRQSLWNDEFYSWEMARQAEVYEILPLVKMDVHPPLYYVILHYFIVLWGSDEIVLRIPSAIAGVLSIFCLYELGRKLYSKKEAAIASGLLAVSMGAIFYSQEARSYSIYMLLTLLSMIMLYSIQERVSAGKTFLIYHLCYLLFTITLLYLHYFALFIIIVQQIILLIFHFKSSISKKQPWNKSPYLLIILLNCLIVFFAYVPWLTSLYYQIMHNANSENFIEPANLQTALQFLDLTLIPFRKFTLVAVVMVFFISFFTIFKWLFPTIKNKYIQAIEKNVVFYDLTILAWLFIPICLLVLINFIKPIIVVRYLINLFPAFYLLIARAISIIPLKNSLKNILSLGFVVYALVGFLRLDYYFHPCDGFAKDYLCKQQTREATMYLNEQMKNKRSTDVYTCLWSKDEVDYYLEKLDSSIRVSENICTQDDFQNAEMDQKTNAMWFVYGKFRPYSKEDLNKFLTDYYLVDTVNYYNIYMNYYERK